MQQSECENFLAAIPDEPDAQVIILGQEARASTARAKDARSTLLKTEPTASVSMATEATAASYDVDFNVFISYHNAVSAVTRFTAVFFVYKRKILCTEFEN